MWVPGIALFLYVALRSLETAAGRTRGRQARPMKDAAPLGYLAAAGERALAILPLTVVYAGSLDRRLRGDRAICCGWALGARRPKAALRRPVACQ